MSLLDVGAGVRLQMPSGMTYRRGSETTYLTIANGAIGTVVGHAGSHAVVVFHEIGGTIGVNVPVAWLRRDDAVHARPIDGTIDGT